MLVVHEERDILSFFIHSIFCIIIHKCINCYPVNLRIYLAGGGLALFQGTVFMSHSHWGMSTP